MLLTRLYLRNFRVYESELDLELPPGLVGVYGPNGSGKSTLLESITWTLWGRARTAKEEIRSAGVGGDCVTEVEFEHEGHIYLVRRVLSGAAATVKAQAHCDGLIMSEGVRDTARYLHSVLGMDDGAFRASVFAEQKQLAAFSAQTPAERRRLVLQLLGITPLDTARDNARRDAKASSDQHQRLRSMLPELEVLELAAADADARAAAAAAEADEAQEVAAAAAARSGAAAEAFRRLDVVRQEYDGLVIEGKGAAGELRAANEALEGLQQELAALEEAAGQLAAAEPAAAGLERLETALRLADAVVSATAARSEAVAGPEPPLPDEEGARAMTEQAAAAGARLAEVEGRCRAAEGELQRARQQAERSAGLSGEADCPLCGQALGAAFEQVQAHRAREVSEAQARLESLNGLRSEAERAARETAAISARAATALEEARRAHQLWERSAARSSDALASWQRSVEALSAFDPVLGACATGPDGAASTEAAGACLRSLKEEVAAGRKAATLAERLRGRLERRPLVLEAIETARGRVEASEAKVLALREKVKSLGFDKGALEAARRGYEEAGGAAESAAAAATAARLSAVRSRAAADGEAQRLADAQAQHAKLAQLEVDSRHLGRLAELLNAFRNTVVASVGPRLAVQAAELFAELTDHEYDQLEVDPDTYQLQISDAGQVYGLERFSGSEVDLANLALRVAISEHVRFQSGGSVGLLVLDEVFGPLDEERKSRMLLALERLRGRFRQILVVTHDAEIKEQLPNAIEVLKRPGRRATARLLSA